MQSNDYYTRITNCITGSVMFLYADTEYARNCAQEAAQEVADMLGYGDDIMIEDLEHVIDGPTLEDIR